MQISDANTSIENLRVDVFQTLNINSKERWYIKKQLSQNKEVFTGQTSFSIRINENFWNNRFDVKNIDEFVNKINSYTRNLLQNELNIFKEDLNDDYIDFNTGKKIIEQIEAILKEKTNNDEILLRMANGSGWHFMTGTCPSRK